MHSSSRLRTAVSVRREVSRFLFGERQRPRRPWAWLLMGVCMGCLSACSQSGVVSNGAAGGVANAGGNNAGGSTMVILVPLDASSIQLGDSAVSNGKTCTADGGKCYVVVDPGPYCGDGLVQEDRGESCDDGNRVGGDGCSGICKLEPNFECPKPGQPCVSTVRCGNGNREQGEACDDGNTDHDDGCSSNCGVEPGWFCPTPGQPCQRLATCGDARLQAGEQCDLGTANGTGVGCDANCVLQPGWTCKGHTGQITTSDLPANCGIGSNTRAAKASSSPAMTTSGCSSTERSGSI